jgi:hypothetical protein
MTDMELLEKAAKAAGMTECGWMGPTFVYVNDKTTFVEWNPLTDDGDAMRLAVKLRMHLTLDDYGVAARIGNVGNTWHGCETHLYGGIESATRRAIVRAAAANG